MNRQLYIIGAGGLGRELGAYIKYINSEYLLKGFYDDITSGAVGSLGSVVGPISAVPELEDDTNLVVAMGEPGKKSEVLNRIPKNERFRFPSFMMPDVYAGDNQSITYGKGSVICSGSRLTTDIRIGSFCLINLNATIGHDVAIGDYSSIMPGATISGGVEIGDGVLVGAGSVLLQGIKVGKGSVVGAGAVVTEDVSPGTIVKGVPARSQ